MKCHFCKKKFAHRLEMHNAAPVVHGMCCVECNYRIVIPARLEALK